MKKRSLDAFFMVDRLGGSGYDLGSISIPLALLPLSLLLFPVMDAIGRRRSWREAVHCGKTGWSLPPSVYTIRQSKLSRTIGNGKRTATVALASYTVSPLVGNGISLAKSIVRTSFVNVSIEVGVSSGVLLYAVGATLLEAGRGTS